MSIPSFHRILFLIFLFLALAALSACNQQSQKPGWPAIQRETRPWTRWWWHGSALTREGITAELEAYQAAGFGGVEITPIYGVYGYEHQFVNYLSPQWMDLLMHTLQEADRLDLGVDMATGTGWPFGGPWIEAADACKNVHHRIYSLKTGERLLEKIEFIQGPYLRAVGNQIYEVHDNAAAEGRKVQGTRKEPLIRFDPKSINIKSLVEPISANKNLQALAIDQVQFEKPLALQVLMAYNEFGFAVDLTDKVNQEGELDWVAPTGNWKLYAVFQGWHGKMVERAGPGGEGNVIDHFSDLALKHYLHRFDSAFQNYDIKPLRAFFNDSYEVDDARGVADWTPLLFDEFKKRRGYDLREYLGFLFASDSLEKTRRIICDYRETVSDLLLANFTRQWKEWAHHKSAIARNQAHGSPANILDLYATVDIPEIEGTEPLRMKMASSAGNVTGKKLISAESATWLDEHFVSNLADIKIALDRFMLNGVNHIFYHGTSYSPPGETWPGWLFYAAVHLNPRNSQWKDVSTLNAYVARCQSILQNSQPDHDVLLYYPIYDRFSTPGSEMLEHFDGIGKQFDSTAFESAAEMMLEKGFAFDYISDAQIGRLTVNEGVLTTEGKSVYKTLVIPFCQFIPLSTFRKIISLVDEGASIIMFRGMPASVSGFGDVEGKAELFKKILARLRSQTVELSPGMQVSTAGTGRLLTGDQLEELLEETGIKRETMTDAGIDFERKIDGGNAIYFIRNRNELFDGWIPLERSASTIVLLNPTTGEIGKGKTRKNQNGSTEVYVQLTSHETMVIRSSEGNVEVGPYRYYTKGGERIELKGPWQLDFISGGPVLPTGIKQDTLTSWTVLGKDYQSFSGTAAYTFSFNKPKSAGQGWLLDLGMVKESAEVFLNNQSVGTLIGPVYQIYISESLMKEKNTLSIHVSNLMANRIAWMDQQGIFWKKFYNVNFPARKAENRVNGLFDASGWEPRASGLIGPVVLAPVAIRD